MTEPLSAKLARLKAERDMQRQRLASAKPHSGKRVLISHQLMRTTTEIMRVEARVKRTQANHEGL